MASASRPTSEPGSAPDTGREVFEKQDLVWYWHKERGWLEAVVISVDRSLQPPSYQIRLTADDSVRDTERTRMRERARDPSEHYAPAATSSPGAAKPMHMGATPRPVHTPTTSSTDASLGKPPEPPSQAPKFPEYPAPPAPPPAYQAPRPPPSSSGTPHPFPHPHMSPVSAPPPATPPYGAQPTGPGAFLAHPPSHGPSPLPGPSPHSGPPGPGAGLPQFPGSPLHAASPRGHFQPPPPGPVPPRFGLGTGQPIPPPPPSYPGSQHRPVQPGPGFFPQVDYSGSSPGHSASPAPYWPPGSVPLHPGPAGSVPLPPGPAQVPGSTPLYPPPYPHAVGGPHDNPAAPWGQAPYMYHGAPPASPYGQPYATPPAAWPPGPGSGAPGGAPAAGGVPLYAAAPTDPTNARMPCQPPPGWQPPPGNGMPPYPRPTNFGHGYNAFQAGQQAGQRPAGYPTGGGQQYLPGQWAAPPGAHPGAPGQQGARAVADDVAAMMGNLGLYPGQGHAQGGAQGVQGPPPAGGRGPPPSGAQYPRGSS